MSTNCLIGKRLKFGAIKAIYCHFDGHPIWVGKTLKKYYTTNKKTDKLIELGSISFLGEDIGCKHSFDSPKDNTVTAFHRDRGDERLNIMNFDSLQSFLDTKFIKYYYLWENNMWKCYHIITLW